MSKEEKHKYAYVFILMKGDKYLPGIICAAYCLRKYKTSYDIIALVTEDVSENARKLMSNIFTHIKQIPYIEYESLPLRTDRQMEIYSSWISISYTKLHAFNLTEYKKVLLLDADFVILQNLDHVFEYGAPAGCFYNSWIADKFNIKEKTGSVMTHNKMKLNLISGNTMSAAILLIEPNKEHFKLMNELAEQLLPFGFKYSYGGSEEQLISLFYSSYLKKNVNILGPEYNTIIWKVQGSYIISDKLPLVLHFFSEIKPWWSTEKYNDYDIWWSCFIKYLNDTKTNIDEYKQYKEFYELYESYNEKKLLDSKCCLCNHLSKSLADYIKIDTSHQTKNCPILFPS